MDDLAEARDLAEAIAEEAGALIRSLHQRVAVEFKPDGSEVTRADTEAEALIRRRLEAASPQVPILGEEFGGEANPIPGNQWVVDPLDGTTAFALGSPMFGTLIALLRDGDPVVGVIHLPVLGETVAASRGTGCWWSSGAGRVRVTTSGVGRLKDAFVSTSGVHATEIEPLPDGPNYRLEPLVRGARKLRMIGDCVQHALVCRGRLDVAIDAAMAPWDSAALIPCVRAAGGHVSDLRGGTAKLAFAGSLISAASGPLIDETLAAAAPGPPTPG